MCINYSNDCCTTAMQYDVSCKCNAVFYTSKAAWTYGMVYDEAKSELASL